MSGSHLAIGGRRPLSEPVGPTYLAKARLPGGERTDRRPVERFAAIGEQREKAIAQKARNRHRRAQLLAGGEREPQVFQAERHREACGLEDAVGDERAVSLVSGRVEEGGSEDFQIWTLVDASFGDERHRFSQRL